MSLQFDPHPYGCPVALAVNPEDFRALVPEIVMRLTDVFAFTVHVVEPSRGQPYPLLNLQPESDDPPRMVLFPGWEDLRRKRRVDYKRQSTLLKRIHMAGVTPERVEDLAGFGNTILDDPLVVRFAATAAQMPQVIVDLDHYLGDTLRITVQTLDANKPVPLRIVRMYAPTSESAPRVIGFPGWRSATEVVRDRLSDDDCYELLERCEVEAVTEVPIEAWLRG